MLIYQGKKTELYQISGFTDETLVGTAVRANYYDTSKADRINT